MSALRTLPGADASGFAEALLDPDSAPPDGVIGPDGMPAPKRFNVYRNNVVVSLSEALGKTYPAVRSLLGEDYFNALARAFLTEHPPVSPVLIWYGEAFADFLAAFPPLEAYPYLADVARVEWAWLQAYHAGDAAPLDPSSLAAVPPESIGSVRFARHPAACLIGSVWPVADLLRANRLEPDCDVSVDLGRSQPVLVVRPDLDVSLVVLRAGADVFISALFNGETLAEAAGAAQNEHAEFSLADCLSDCLSNGAFTSLAADVTD
ncbi:DNA-binding domain-containing protein [Roseibium sp.]|uniref:HvfC/BufC N-terminal domain-containing protein n=2 Tax=Roseibium sp. TaxID=1936156 RepID=UPI003267732E